MKIAFIFTNYNNSSYSKKAIDSIESAYNKSLNEIIIIIIDNDSNEENINILKEIQSRCSFVDIIYNKENIGYFSGLNCGLKLLANKYTDFHYAIIGNNDLIFKENFHGTLLNSTDIFIKYPVISPNIKTLNGEHQNPHVIKKISKFREFIYDIYYSNYYLANMIIKLAQITRKYTDRKDEEQHFKAQEIYQGYGACYILTPLFFDNFQKLWAPTFLMYEEFFLSKQLADKGFKIYYEPSIHVTHALHSSTGTLPRKKIWQIGRESHREYRKYVKTFNFKKENHPHD